MVSEAFSHKVKQHVADHFDQSTLKYQEFEEKYNFFAALALRLARAIGMAADASVLDVGCGNGISALALHEHFGCKVLGMDLSPKMVSAGRSLCRTADIRLVVGDGEDLVRVAAGETFDYVLYNASLFIFPDAGQSIRGAVTCLRPGGKIAFSFYPQLVSAQEDDLLALAFGRLGFDMPRYRVITEYAAACQALMRYCGNIRQHRWVRPLDIDFLKKFFNIPAQSASLFPGFAYADRCDRVNRLFDTLATMAPRGNIVWRMAEGSRRD